MLIATKNRKPRSGSKAEKYSINNKELYDWQDGVEAQIEKERKKIDYDTREFTIEYLVNKYKNGLRDDKNQIFVPNYQRAYVWENDHASRFIEAIFQGLPIPYFYFAETKEGRLEIIDGSQRIQTLHKYLQNELKLSGLKIIDELNGSLFEQLTESRKRKFENRPLRCIVLRDLVEEETRALLFERINTSSVTLTEQQARKGAYTGKFTDLLTELTQNELFTSQTRFTELAKKSQTPQELILRFFAWNFKLVDYSSNNGQADFLDTFLKETNKELNADAKQIVSYLDEFTRVFSFIQNKLPGVLIYPSNGNKTPLLRFEAITVGVARALRKRPDLEAPQENLLENETFNKLTGQGIAGTASYRKLLERITFVEDWLLGNKTF